MGTEARFQAIPENCELLKRARQELEIAGMMQFFNQFAAKESDYSYFYQDPLTDYIYIAAQELARLHPDLEKRYFYARGRTYDAIIYLLSPARRNVAEWNSETDPSFITKAIYGVERLHPMGCATQGGPLGFVSTRDTRHMLPLLEQVTREKLHEHYDPLKMYEAGVYKISPDHDENRFEVIWEEFVGMRDVYRAAAYNYEAVITVID